MKRSQQFTVNLLEAMIVAFEREIRSAEQLFADMRPEDMKAEDTRADYMTLMAVVSKAKDQLELYKEAVKMVSDPSTIKDGKPAEKASIGFTAQLKEAA